MKPTAQMSTPQRQTNSARGFTLVELLIVVAIILILAGIAIPNMLRSKMAANQASAVSNLRTITTAAVSYWVTYGNGYPPSLAAMGGVGPGATCDAAVLLDTTITTAPYQKAGYQFKYTGDQGQITLVVPGCSNQGYHGYVATATPVSLGTTGNMSYCSTEPGVLHVDINGSAISSATACDGLPGLQ